MNYIITLSKESDIYLDADGFILGNDCYATRLIRSFDLDEIKELKNKIHKLNKLIYINMNKIFHNNELEKLEKFIDNIKDINPDGIIFSDMGLYNICKRKGIENKLIYNPDTLITNVYDFNYGSLLGIKGCFISPFINLDDINYITANKKLECFYIGFGYLNIFNSKRHLISTYFKYKNINNDPNLKYQLKEELRDYMYPYYEDKNGTYMFTPYIFNSLGQNLKGIDNFVMDFILIEDKIDLFTKIKNNQIDMKCELGFLNKEIVYKKVK